MQAAIAVLAELPARARWCWLTWARSAARAAIPRRRAGALARASGIAPAGAGHAQHPYAVHATQPRAAPAAQAVHFEDMKARTGGAAQPAGMGVCPREKDRVS